MVIPLIKEIFNRSNEENNDFQILISKTITKLKMNETFDWQSIPNSVKNNIR